MSAEVVGLRIKCDTLERAITIPRVDYAIGPIDVTDSRGKPKYVIRCECGEVHQVAMKRAAKPTRTKLSTSRGKQARKTG